MDTFMITKHEPGQIYTVDVELDDVYLYNCPKHLRHVKVTRKVLPPDIVVRCPICGDKMQRIAVHSFGTL